MARAHASLLKELEQGVRQYLENEPPSAPAPGEPKECGARPAQNYLHREELYPSGAKGKKTQVRRVA
jgi:hypothetical protein